MLATKDHSMIRKAAIEVGVTAPVSFFDPLLEWDTIPAVVVRLDENGDTLFGTSGNPLLDGNWNSLGSHDCSCNPASLNETVVHSISVYPNPSDGIVNVNLHQSVSTMRLTDAFGKDVKIYRNLQNSEYLQLDLSKLRGVYILYFEKKSGNVDAKKIILK